MRFIHLPFQLWLMLIVLDESIIPALGSTPRKNLDFMELTKYDGYDKAEEHYVTTKDGYILRIFRIPPNNNCTTTKGIIMFMHGLYLSSDDCIIPGPGVAHCYIYSDNCYDVWAPNVRGNYYSKNHTTYDPKTDPRFWDFSVDEMAIYDLPVSIDYVLNVTSNTQLSFVGHSQGVTMLLILCSKQPEYNDKIKVGVGLSVTSRLTHSKFIVIQIQNLLASGLTQLINLGVNTEILPRGGLVQTSGSFLCGISNFSYPACSLFLFAVLGYNEYQITDEVFQTVVGHTPSGTSLKDFNHWGEMKDDFAEYDYGSIKNLIVYGQTKPPAYDVSKITMKWLFLGSLNDYVANLTDVNWLAKKMPNANLCVLSDSTFGHLDFIYGKDIPNYITPSVLSIIENDLYTCV